MDINELAREIESESGPQQPAVTLYSFGFDAEELLCAYGALRSYLKALAQQENEDLAMIERVTHLLIEIRPSAVKAAQSLSLKAVGMEGRNG